MHSAARNLPKAIQRTIYFFWKGHALSASTIKHRGSDDEAAGWCDIAVLTISSHYDEFAKSRSAMRRINFMLMM
jgi:hypothetical protein